MRVGAPTAAGSRPSRLPISDVLVASLCRTYDRFPSRRATNALTDLYERGILSTVPHFNSLTTYLADPALTPILTNLIVASSVPLASVETDFALDSTGFSTCRFERWFEHKYGRPRPIRQWIKAHVMIGTRTNIVTAIEVTPGTHHDATYLPSLLKDTSANFDVSEVSADKAYSTKRNLAAVMESGAVPYIAFKANTAPVGDDGTAWSRMYHEFCLNRDEFLQRYHRRSNVETTFHRVKTKFGDSLRSKSETGQVNELLTKFLAHNICCVIGAVHELGIEPNFG